MLFLSVSIIIIKLSVEERQLICRSGGMADATDSKSVGSDTVWVQVPPSAPVKRRPCGRLFSCDMKVLRFKKYGNPSNNSVKI